MKLNGWGFDIESDSLYLMSKKIWYIRFKSVDGKKELSIYPFRQSKEKSKKQITEWIDSFEDNSCCISFNGLGFDHWMLWKFFDIKPVVSKKGQDYLGDKKVIFVDGFVLNQYIDPNSKNNSLADLTEDSDEGKIDYRKYLVEKGVMKGDEPKGFEFTFWNDYMKVYCDRDVDSMLEKVKELWDRAIYYYKDKWIHPSFKQMQKDYFLYSAQAYTGVKFNIEKANSLVLHIEEEMKKIKDIVDPQLPPRPLKTAEQAFYKQPAKPFTKAGEFSANMQKWLEKHNAKIIDNKIHAYGFEVDIEPNAILPVKLPMEIDDNTELKDWFITSGWVPSEDYWNFKKGPDGKPIRDEKGKLIKTTPKINNQGKLCPNLEKLEGELPSQVVKYLSYRNRLGVVKGWLSTPRLEFDGRLSAEITGYAPTSRVKHAKVVNVPKADPKVLLGSEMRDLFTVEEGNYYCGTDAAALENRTLSHYTYKYDNGAFAEMNLNGDIHSFNSFAFFPHLHKEFDINNPENKENPEFKSWRNKAKTGAYLLAFGGGAPKLASSLGLSSSEGKKAYDNYWESNKGLGLLKKAVEHYYDTTGQKKTIPAIDGRLVFVRGKNVLLSCLGQGCGAIAMSYAACFMDTWLGEMQLDELGRPYYEYQGYKVKRISMVHDEYSWEVEKGAEEAISKMSVKAIVKAGEVLKLSIPLAGEGKIAYEGSWKDVH